jgi:hypothetical protein
MSTSATLYHYCSLPTFKSIFDSQTIRLSDISKSNDYQELKYAKIELMLFTMEFVTNYYQNAVNESKNGKGFDLSKINQKDLDDAIKLTETSKNINLSQQFVFCLSKLRDRLSQWRGYGDNGRGIAIGFDKKYFNQVTKNLENKLSIRFDQVTYGRRNLVQYFKEKSTLSDLNFTLSSKEISRIFNFAVIESEIYAVFAKNEAFIEEGEWRFVISRYQNLEIINDSANENLAFFEECFTKKFHLPKLNFNATDQKLIPYFELEFTNFKKAINEVIIGPKSNVSIDDIKQYLIHRGLLNNKEDTSIKISKSSSTYR